MSEGEIMGNVYYCPDCSSKLEEISGCGSVSYFCNKCNLLISRKRILTEEQIVEKIAKKAIEKINDSEE